MKLYTPSRITRRLGERFFFKAERDLTPKSVSVRRPYPPGMRSRRSRRSLSEFGLALTERQKVRYTYGVSSTALRRYAERARRARGRAATAVLVELLERRLDNAIFRLGLAPSRRIARQLVSHGHITMNGRRVRTPSREVRQGDELAVQPRSRSHPVFGNIAVRLKNYEPPAWLRIVPEELRGEVLRAPEADDAALTLHTNRVIEYFSR